MKKLPNKKFFICLIILMLISVTSICLVVFNKTPDKAIAKQSSPSTEIIEDEPINKIEEPIYFTIKEEVTIETGQQVLDIKDFFEDEVELSESVSIKYYLDENEISLDEITILKDNITCYKGTNKYKVVINDTQEYISYLNVIDTTAPTIILKDWTITTGDKYSATNFLSQYSDNSSSINYTINFKDQSKSALTTVGTNKIDIVVCDESNNCTESTANLIIKAKAVQSNTTTSNTNKNNTTSSSSNKNQSNSSSSTSSNQNQSSTSQTTPAITLVKTTEEKVILKSTELKYGVKSITYVMIKYNVYSDGSKKEVSRGSEVTTIDRSGFNGTVATMKSEALSVYNNYETSRSTVLDISNEYRAEVGASAMTIDKDLSVMATIRAIEIAWADYFSHTRPDGRDWYTIWADYYNININSLNATIGENLAAGYSSDASACNGWKNSQLHYENIINTSFNKLGVGKYELNGKTYWVQLFQS